MESIVAAWNDMGILNEVWKHKLIFVETPDANETSIALENYRRVSMDLMWLAPPVRVADHRQGV